MSLIKFMKKIRIGIVYLWAVLLALLVPVFFFSMNSPTVEKFAKKIPLREGNFGQDGSLQLSQPEKR